MNDHTDPGHPDFDALSAHLDGEAPEWESHVAGCAECRTTLKWLRTAITLVATPVPRTMASVREDAIARALEAFTGAESAPETVVSTPGPPPVIPAPAPMRAAPPSAVPAPIPISAGSRRRRGGGSGLWVGVGSAAAVLVAFVIGVSVLTGGGGRDESTTTFAGPPAADEVQTRSQNGGDAGRSSAAESPETVGATGGAAGAAVSSAGDGGVDGGDLGDIADASTLAARARPTLLAAVGSPTAAAESPTPAPSSGVPLVPKAVGTRPCEMEARSARPDLGTVVYYATGRVGGVPVVVLGFGPDPGSAPVTLLALAQPEGCRVVLEAAGP